MSDILSAELASAAIRADLTTSFSGLRKTSRHGLPLFQSKKIVAAALITSTVGLSENPPYVMVRLEPTGPETKIEVPAKFASRERPTADFSVLVEYLDSDHYLSHSPLSTFIAGHTPARQVPHVQHIYQRGDERTGNHIVGLTTLPPPELKTTALDELTIGDPVVIDFPNLANQFAVGDYLRFNRRTTAWRITNVQYLKGTDRPIRLTIVHENVASALLDRLLSQLG